LLTGIVDPANKATRNCVYLSLVDWVGDVQPRDN